VTVRGFVVVFAHSVPTAPLQPVKAEPESGVAVKVTELGIGVPKSARILFEHVLLQLLGTTLLGVGVGVAGGGGI